MDKKIDLLRKVLLKCEEVKTKLKIISLRGNFECILIKKISENDILTEIQVKTLDNENPDYKKNQIIKIDLNDSGLIEIIYD